MQPGRRLLVLALVTAVPLAACDGGGTTTTPTPATAVTVDAVPEVDATAAAVADEVADPDQVAASEAAAEAAQQAAVAAAAERVGAAAQAAATESARVTTEVEQAVQAAAQRAAEAERAAEEAARLAAEQAANRDLQERLADLGFYDGAIDGDLGPVSTTAVRAFQAANGLTVDGVVGTRTRAALDDDDAVTAAAVLAAEKADDDPDDGGDDDADDGDDADADDGEDDDADADDGEEDGDDGDDNGEDDDGGDDDGGTVMSAAEAEDRLRDLGYWGGSTWSALMAFQKVNDLSVDGNLGPATSAALADPRSPDLVGGASTRIEVDLDEQVVHWIEGGSRVRTMNASSGSGETFQVDGVGGVEALTPTGTFVIERRISGLREGALGGMYDPMYFFHGWALHGSNSVPAHPASHGCVRLSRSDASWLFDQAPDGTPVVLHGGRNSFVPGGPDQPPIL